MISKNLSLLTLPMYLIVILSLFSTPILQAMHFCCYKNISQQIIPTRPEQSLKQKQSLTQQKLNLANPELLSLSGLPPHPMQEIIFNLTKLEDLSNISNSDDSYKSDVEVSLNSHNCQNLEITIKLAINKVHIKNNETRNPNFNKG